MPENDMTILYYTSNREPESFEAKVQEQVLAVSDGSEIVSVSQKPMNFGRNICLGDMGCCQKSMLAQILAGLEASTTRYVGMAESDVLYPPGYFSYRPARDDTLYYAAEVYVLWAPGAGFRHSVYWPKRRQELSCVASRTELLRLTRYCLDSPEDNIQIKLNSVVRREYFHPGYAVISIKTGNGMHRTSPIRRAGKRMFLPYWGKSHAVLARYGLRSTADRSTSQEVSACQDA